MKHLVEFRKYLVDKITDLTDDKLFVTLVNGKDNQENLHYNVRVLLIDFRGNPFDILLIVRSWLRMTNRIIYPSIVPVVSFECEIINSETFDLQLEFPLSDKLVDDCEGGHVCPPQVWSEFLGMFVAAESI